MLTVPEAAKKLRRNPETIRRWIRAGRLRSRRVGTQYLVDERDIEAIAQPPTSLRLPTEWNRTFTGEQQPDWVAAVQKSRGEH